MYGCITLSSGEDVPSTSPSQNLCIDNTSPSCASPVIYATEVLQCDEYTLNLTVASYQAMELQEFSFIPCTSDDNNNNNDSSLGTVSTIAYEPAASPIAAEKKQALNASVIVGAVIGALVFFALTSLAFFIFLRRGRRISRPSTSSTPSKPSASASPPSFFSRPRPWSRLTAGSQSKPKLNTSSPRFLAPVSVPSSSFVIVSRENNNSGRVRPPTPFDVAGTASASASAPAAQVSVPSTTTTTGLAAPTLPWLFDHPSAYYPSPPDGQQQQQSVNRDVEWGEEKQALRHNDAEMDTVGMAIAHGYLPDSKELMAWGEAADPQTSPGRTTEALPQYQSRGSLRWSS